MNKTFLSVTQFILAVALAPLAWASAVIFHKYAVSLPGAYDDFFYWGMFGFVVIFLFFYQFWGVYEFGQRLVAGLVQFAAPANHFIAKIIPFYVTCLLLLFYVVKHLLGADNYDHYFMFFTGFALTMHILLTAQELQGDQKVFLSSRYLFSMTCFIILLAAVVTLLFNLVLQEWTFPDLAVDVWNEASEIYAAVLGKLLNLG